MPSDEKGFASTNFVESSKVDISDVDRDALNERYRIEREKRAIKDRAATVDLVGDLAHYFDDPYTEPSTREPVKDEVDVIIVGSGFGALIAAANMSKAGFERIRIIDKAGDVGGVWYWNRYPGAMCDVESLTYLPLLEETGYIPKEKYARAPEILAYAQTIAKDYDLYELGLFQTTVTGMTWEDDLDRWVVSTDRDDELRAQFVIIADGNFSRLKIPAIPGVETFKGHSFHTSRWDYDYTGGDSLSELTKIGDKRVGIIGTGATAAQAVPPLGRGAKELFVFQRTPSTVGVRGQGPIDAEYVAGLQPGWQAERVKNFTSIVMGNGADVDLIQDGWTDYPWQVLGDPSYAALSPDEKAQRMQDANLAQMEAIRARVDSIVQDPSTADALKPWYPYMCTRPVFHDEYLQTFNLPGVTLVDTDGHGIERITENAIIVDGVEYEIDCLVWATGFEYETTYTQKTGFDLVGVDGVKLSEKYVDGISSFQGLYTRGFPNLFMVPGTFMQNTMTLNVVHMLGENTTHMAYVASQVRDRGATRFDVSETHEREWVAECVAHSRDNEAWLEQCTPNRFNAEGDLERRKLQNANYPLQPMDFFALLQEWREKGDLDGLELSPASS
ncbi:MAG: NAD(P)/FAD-dependent oxidoreductase [Mycetocola sp.]